MTELDADALEELSRRAEALAALGAHEHILASAIDPSSLKSRFSDLAAVVEATAGNLAALERAQRGRGALPALTAWDAVQHTMKQAGRR